MPSALTSSLPFHDGAVTERARCYEVDVLDPLEVARWAWLLDVDGVQLRHAVKMVGPNGEAVAEYLEMFCRYTATIPS
jgi:hypothetical protein